MDFPQSKLMYVYNDKGEFDHLYNAQLSPLEPGVYIIPEKATDIAPPVAPANSVAIFTGLNWVFKPDFRGTVVYNVDTLSESVITEIGDLPMGILSKEVFDLRPDGNYDYDQLTSSWVLNIDRKRSRMQPLDRFQVRKILNLNGLRQAVEDAITAGSQDLKDEWALRDSFVRTNPLLNNMATQLGMTDIQIDAMFEAGVTL
jgi:hypothetical protein